MAYLACMIIGSMVTIACACICAIDKDDSKDNNNNYCLLLSVSGMYIAVIDKETGEVIEVYKNAGKEGRDFKYEREGLK